LKVKTSYLPVIDFESIFEKIKKESIKK
jgi:hypothetical protein